MNDLNSVGSMEECEAFAKERNKKLAEGRIINLVEQAIENVANKRVLKDGVVERTWNPGDYERELVKLVVLECIAVIKRNEGASLNISNFEDLQKQGIQLGLEFAICDIEEHFGVNDEHP